MHIYHAYCRNNLKRQSVFTRPIVSLIGQQNDVMKCHEMSHRLILDTDLEISLVFVEKQDFS